MDSEKRLKVKGFLKSRCSRVILALLAAIAILAVIIPPAAVVTLRKKSSMGPKSNILVPLYIYPAQGAWTRLEEVISTNSDVNFTVIINPGNGPGRTALPDGNYTREIPKLSRYDNVRLVGYVPTTYAKRNISLVHQDIATYASWPTISSNPDLTVRGIFFDETPQAYDASSLEYLRAITTAAKEMPGLGPDCFVIHNPGAIPDSRYLPTADSTVVFEGTYDSFNERYNAKLFKGILENNRSYLSMVVHSVPNSVKRSGLRELVKRARGVAEEIFITRLDTDYYASFDEGWEEFVNLMASR